MPCPCRAHDVSLPCRAAKGLECVFPIWFTQCGRVWFILTMPGPCRAHAVPLPCRASKSLECVFPIWFTHCGRVWFTLAMPCPCHAHAMLWSCRSSQGHGTARHRRREKACGIPAHVRLLPATMRGSTNIVIRSIPILLTTIHTYDCKDW